MLGWIAKPAGSQSACALNAWPRPQTGPTGNKVKAEGNKVLWRHPRSCGCATVAIASCDGRENERPANNDFVCARVLAKASPTSNKRSKVVGKVLRNEREGENAKKN